jgi:hypothetical protein
MAFVRGTSGITNLYVGDTPVTGLYLGATKIWEPFTTPAETIYTTVGDYSFTIPTYCTRIDIILLGGGKGGEGSQNSAAFFGIDGQGGNAGSWTTTTWVRGVDIPWNITTITGSVGAGGANGDYNGVDGGNGGNSTATYSGGSTISGLGATSQTGSRGAYNSNGASAGSVLHNGRTYYGGTGGVCSHSDPAPSGNPPGGGGAGGWLADFGNKRGGAGGRGQVWFYAY